MLTVERSTDPCMESWTARSVIQFDLSGTFPCVSGETRAAGLGGEAGRSRLAEKAAAGGRARGRTTVHGLTIRVHSDVPEHISLREFQEQSRRKGRRIVVLLFLVRERTLVERE